VTGLHSKDQKRPDIIFWFEGKTHVIDVTVTDPFNLTNTNRINHSASSKRAKQWKRNSSLRFDARAAQYELVHSTVEKRKNRHYKELIESMQRTVHSDSAIQFHTAGAFTTGGLSPEFRELIRIINVMAQKETGGWDPGEVMDGLTGCVGVTIQVGNAMVLNDSWNRIAQRNCNVLLKPERQKRGVRMASSCREESSSCTEPTRTFALTSVA
jgi:hypothetical protein